MPIECAQGDRPARCPNHFSAVNEPSAVPWWWCFVLWSEVFWCLDVCCGVRSCDGHVIWCDVMACVVSCHVMQCDVMVMSCTTPVLLCTTKYYSNTTPYYKYYSVLPCATKYYSSTTLYYSSTTLYYSSINLYYKVLLQHKLEQQSTTPILPCTTKYFSSTIKYYKVLRQYYSVLQSTTPYYKVLLQYYKVLLQYYSNTTLYYKVPLKYYSVLLQYYLVLQSTTPVLPRTTKYLMIDPHHIWNVIYKARSNRHHPPTSPNTAPATQNESHDWSTSHMKRHLQCAEQQASPSNFSKYCACHAKWISWLIRIAYETSFTMRRATGITLQLHQILRLPRKMNLMIDPHHIWNVIYNARSNRHHPPTSPNTAPATQNESHDWSTSHMKRHLQCAEQQASPSNFTNYCACHAKWISWLIHITYETSFTMRGATGITLQLHQLLRLPRKMNLMIDPHHIWNVIYNARSNRHQSPTSPNTAPTTQNCTPKS